MDAIYARQSVDKADSLSIQGQIDLCRRETGEEVSIYQDKGFSGGFREKIPTAPHFSG